MPANALEKPPEQPKVPTPEAAPSPEKAEVPKEIQKAPEKKPAELSEPAPERQPAAAALPQTKVKKSETLERIEDIMEEDLEEVYTELSSEKKQEFRQKGEETAKEIEGMMYKVKIKSKKIFKLLFGWLRVIPHVNKYFLEQEAKLKTDEIMHLKEDIEKRGGQPPSA